LPLETGVTMLAVADSWEQSTPGLSDRAGSSGTLFMPCMVLRRRTPSQRKTSRAPRRTTPSRDRTSRTLRNGTEEEDANTEEDEPRAKDDNAKPGEDEPRAEEDDG